jgi:hypothetical protein
MSPDGSRKFASLTARRRRGPTGPWRREVAIEATEIADLPAVDAGRGAGEPLELDSIVEGDVVVLLVEAAAGHRDEADRCSRGRSDDERLLDPEGSESKLCWLRGMISVGPALMSAS